MKQYTLILFLLITIPTLAMQLESQEEKQFEVPSLFEQSILTIPKLTMWKDPDQAIEKIFRILPTDLIEEIGTLLKDYPFATKPKKLPVHGIFSFDRFCSVGLKHILDSDKDTLELIDMHTGQKLQDFQLDRIVEKAVLSPDKKYIVILQKCNGKKFIKITDIETKKTETELLAEKIQNIRFIENTDFLELTDDYKNQYFGEVKSLIEISSGSLPLDTLKKIRKLPDAPFKKLKKVDHFFIGSTGVWPGDVPAKLHVNFHELDTILYKQHQVTHSFVNSDGNHLVANPGSNSIAIWDLFNRVASTSMQITEIKDVSMVQWTPDDRITLQSREGEFCEIELANMQIAKLLEQKLLAQEHSQPSASSD